MQALRSVTSRARSALAARTRPRQLLVRTRVCLVPTAVRFACQHPLGLLLLPARAMSSSSAQPVFNMDEALRELGVKFGDARLEIEDALDSVGTTYFNEDVQSARELVQEVLRDYELILSHADGAGKSSIQSAWGLKLEQLKGELAQLEASSEDAPPAQPQQPATSTEDKPGSNTGG